MKCFLIGLVIIISSNSCNNLKVKNKINFADNVVIAHRGAWKNKQLPENSIAALKQAIHLGCSGSEFDVRMTADDVLIVNHDQDYNDMHIEESNYADLAKVKLSNGETLPTLKDYILAGMENNFTTGMVCEIKPSKTKERGQRIAKKVLYLVKELKAESYIACYISFDYAILKKIIEIEPNSKTQYLNGDKSPYELNAIGISGLDYNINTLKKNPEWVKSAKDLNLVLNAWTANSKEDLKWLMAKDFDFITTNEPELLFDLIEESNN